MWRSVLIKKLVIEDEEVIALSQYYKVEKVLADSLILLNSDCENSKLDVSDDIALYETINKIKMHENQKDAVNLAVNNGVTIITGGPGTGKTTIVKCMLQVFKNLGKKVKLMAPTGRAAKRLSESTGEEASTIHRALEMTGGDESRFFYNNMTKLNYDVIIVDEVSMVDVQLMYYLVRAIKRGTKLILVGDKDQLASVGAGNVLGDILASKCFATMYLTQIYRQSEDSLIIVNAHAINNGEMPKLNNSSRDFFFDNKDSGEKVLDSIVNMCTTRIPNFLNIDSSKVQVLAPS